MEHENAEKFHLEQIEHINQEIWNKLIWNLFESKLIQAGKVFWISVQNVHFRIALTLLLFLAYFSLAITVSFSVWSPNAKILRPALCLLLRIICRIGGGELVVLVDVFAIFLPSPLHHCPHLGKGIDRWGIDCDGQVRNGWFGIGWVKEDGLECGQGRRGWGLDVGLLSRTARDGLCGWLGVVGHERRGGIIIIKGTWMVVLMRVGMVGRGGPTCHVVMVGQGLASKEFIPKSFSSGEQTLKSNSSTQFGIECHINVKCSSRNSQQSFLKVGSLTCSVWSEAVVRVHLSVRRLMSKRRSEGRSLWSVVSPNHAFRWMHKIHGTAHVTCKN